ncbi:hypothetical protein UY3_02651 [Chelonia mydas]|uniref:Uncharacterized protein n=1 Tax=Chelonia mydas TaxID=8469 RepID=M7CGU2_CHEMY|nr:hypothetical protein UY3_02651 [Chelonia mydas]
MSWPPLPTASIGLERQTVASGSCDRPNLRTLQGTETSRVTWVTVHEPVTVKIRSTRSDVVYDHSLAHSLRGTVAVFQKGVPWGEEKTPETRVNMRSIKKHHVDYFNFNLVDDKYAVEYESRWESNRRSI